MSLKTDYKDDILAVGNLRKYQMIQNNDGTVSFQDVTQYEQTGDVFGAGDINRTNQAVNEKFDSGDVVDPMLTTEPGFAADAYQTKLQFDEQNKNFKWKLAGSANGSNAVSLKNLEYNEIQIFVTNTKSATGWYDSSLVISKNVLLKQKLIFLPSYYAMSNDCNYIACKYDAQTESVYISHNNTGTVEKSTLEIYYR